MDIPIFALGDPTLSPTDYEAVLEADASFGYEDRVEGQAWRLTIKGHEYAIRVKSRRYAKGPVVAELRAIIDGMKEAVGRNVNSLIIRTDSRWCAHVLVRLWEPKQAHTQSAAVEALNLLESFQTVAVVHTRTRTMERVDRAARSAADKRRVQISVATSRRLEIVRKLMGDASTVSLLEVEGSWIANGTFLVTIDPPSCTCPAWSTRWEKVPLPGKRAQRNPCKHIVAAAVREGFTDAASVLALAKRATS